VAHSPIQECDMDAVGLAAVIEQRIQHDAEMLTISTISGTNNLDWLVWPCLSLYSIRMALFYHWAVSLPDPRYHSTVFRNPVAKSVLVHKPKYWAVRSTESCRCGCPLDLLVS